MNSTSTAPYRRLALDIGLPLGLYFGLHDGFGVALVTSLVISSIPPAIRELAGLIRDRHVNALAALMLATNLAGVASSLISGDARLVFAKDSLISSTIAIAIVVSVRRGRPMLSDGLQAFVVRARPERDVAWRRLQEESARFRSLDARFSLVWGTVLLADCAARLIGAVTLPVATMAWASTAILVIAMTVASILSGAVASTRMLAMVDAEVGDRGAHGRHDRATGGRGERLAAA